MKIDQIANLPTKVSSTANVTAAKGGAARASTTTASAAPSTGNLNSLAAQARQLQTQLVQPGSADFDTARVAEIRQAISEGRYQVDTGKIADGLLDTVRDLLGKQTS
ncbi:flagellar biosynthesis anti-sigma factor FlgM [Herminiimonas sp. CN]|uniref:flagellar biosynthesis anti-sigma factor FlgM n=1 Tax=Herminiimonas sp. CN TaxID=1349818 RepID=UPI0004743921|nr:flagellar biosynthesis anti-sigma factor FlgM [Herminiimonas sp. CN]